MPEILSKGDSAGTGPEFWRLGPSAGPLKLRYQPPGDEFISQLALVLGALCTSPLQISGVSRSSACLQLMGLLRQLGAEIAQPDEETVDIFSPEGRLRSPDHALDCGSSATTFLLLCGLTAGRKLSVELSSSSLQIVAAAPQLLQPLTELGAELLWPSGEGRLPLRIRGCPLRPLQVKARWELPAHKAMLLIAALGCVGSCEVLESLPGPDHCERLLRYLGVELERSGSLITLRGESPLKPAKLRIPGDPVPVSALLAAATLIPGSEVEIPMVGANPSRFGFVRKLARLGPRLERQRDWQFGTEPVTALSLKAPRRISGFNVPPNLTQSLLDEFPLLALIATQAQGSSHMRGAEGLARRMPNQLALTVHLLREFGADIEQDYGGVTVNGPRPLYGAAVHCADEPQVALLAAATALVASGHSSLSGIGELPEIYPDFIALMDSLGA